MDADKIHALYCAREDLVFALSHPECLIGDVEDEKFSPGRDRLEHSIEMITKALGDKEAFEKMKKEWEEREKEDLFRRLSQH